MMIVRMLLVVIMVVMCGEGLGGDSEDGAGGDIGSGGDDGGEGLGGDTEDGSGGDIGSGVR